jgi:hypothetical protein
VVLLIHNTYFRHGISEIRRQYSLHRLLGAQLQRFCPLLVGYHVSFDGHSCFLSASKKIPLITRSKTSRLNIHILATFVDTVEMYNSTLSEVFTILLLNL